MQAEFVPSRYSFIRLPCREAQSEVLFGQRTHARRQVGMTEEAPGSAAVWIFALLFTWHLSLKLYARITPSGGFTTEERQLLKEIKELHRSANELSTPATFAKSAKLQRQADVKEKELAQLKEKLSVRKSWWLPFAACFPRGLTAAVYLLLTLWFWRTSVATVPADLLKPSELFLRVGKRDSSGELVAVGIVPWLVLSSRVSEFLSPKIVGRPPQKPPTRRKGFLEKILQSS